MAWPTWNQAAVAAALCVVVFLVLRRSPTPPWRAHLAQAAKEFSLIAALYTVWRLARLLPLEHDQGAVQRARDINRWQHDMHMPSELSLQHFVIRHEWLGKLSNWYYAILHVPALIAFLLWLFVRHRDAFAKWRSALAMTTAACVLIRFVRVAPPRLVPGLGYIDLSAKYGWSIYGPVGTGISDQFAAMPSIHVAWAAVVSIGIVATSTSKWRWLFMLHLVFTMLVVSDTGNHWWLDGLVAIALLGVAVVVDSAVRSLVRSRRGDGMGSARLDQQLDDELDSLVDGSGDVGRQSLAGRGVGGFDADGDQATRQPI